MAVGKLLDYSQARPSLAQVQAAGYSAVYRYVCSDTSEEGMPGKRLTPAERDQILAAGLDLGIHGEDEAGAVRGGYQRGKAQGQQWAEYMSTVLQAPKGMTIVVAVDVDIDHDGDLTLPQVAVDYFGGIDDGLDGEYVSGTYGEYSVLLGAHAAGLGRGCYVMTNAWDVDNPPAFCHVHQLPYFPAGAQAFSGTDYNDILRTPHGTWLQTLNGDDMTPEQEAKLDAIISGLGVVVRGDEKDAPTGDTHPDNIQRTRQDIAAFRAETNTKLDAVLGAEAAEATAIAGVLAAVQAGGIDPVEAAASIASVLKTTLPADIVAELSTRLAS